VVAARRASVREGKATTAMAQCTRRIETTKKRQMLVPPLPA
jgi:hypothetical protein